MLKEARIVLPQEGQTESASVGAHRYLREQLVEHFGGYTSFRGNCGIDTEEVTIYDVALEADRDASWDKIYQLAVNAARLINQEAVYVRYPDGGVEIVDLVDLTKRRTYHHDHDTSHLSDETGDVHDLPNRPGGPPAYKTDRIVRHEIGPGVTRHDHAPRDKTDEWDFRDTPLGAKRLPQKGELWDTRCGARVAVLGYASIMDGGYNITILDKRASSIAVQPGFVYVVDLDGRYIRAGKDNDAPLDLVSCAGRFDI